jgi:hypothetical protein
LPSFRRAGQRRYYSAKPCKHRHTGPRFTSSGGCVQCKVGIMKKLYAKRALAERVLNELGMNL